MRSLERGRKYETLDKNIARIAYAYGFSAAPVVIGRKSLAAAPDGTDAKTAAAIALMKSGDGAKNAAQSWGLARHGAGTLVSFSITGAKQAVAHAIVIKTALSVAELAGFSNLTVLISSVGDLESRKRFTRELANFFRKQHEVLSPEIRTLAAHNPDAAYRALLQKSDPLLSRAPRPVDYLSESSRKAMLSVLSLLEAAGIAYAMNPRLETQPGVNSELVFAIEGVAKDGTVTRIASGGRYDEYFKREQGKAPGNSIAVSVEIPKRVDAEEMEEEPICFLAHVGDAAKLKTFGVIEALWRAHVAVGQALMAENLREQIQLGQDSHAKYFAIIGQREALDGTVIVRSVATQVQATIPWDKLSAHLSRGHRA